MIGIWKYVFLKVEMIKKRNRGERILDVIGFHVTAFSLSLSGRSMD